MGAGARHRGGPEVVIVGGGLAGITTSAVLRRAGIHSIVIDRAGRVGSSWRDRYDRLRLNTSRLTSRVAGTRFGRGTSLFPSRDEFADYLEMCADRHDVRLRLGTTVERLEPAGRGFVVETSEGTMTAAHVVVATGYAREPVIPAWPGRERCTLPVLHSARYRHPAAFRGIDVLVVGSGSSGMEIAHDLLEGGAARVRLAVRTPPSIALRAVGGVPGDPLATALVALPPRVADVQFGLAQRLLVGDLAPFGLPRPAEGPFARALRDGSAPAVVDRDVLRAIRERRIEIVPGVERLERDGVVLAGGGRVEPQMIIAATGFRCGLEPLVGHLGVLDGRGVPATTGGRAARPGLHFVGYDPLPGLIRRTATEAARAARSIAGSARR